MAKMTIGSVRAVKMAIDAAAQGARSEDDLARKLGGLAADNSLWEIACRLMYEYWANDDYARQVAQLALESPLAWAECDREAAALEKARKAAKRRAYAAIDARASM